MDIHLVQTGATVESSAGFHCSPGMKNSGSAEAVTKRRRAEGSGPEDEEMGKKQRGSWEGSKGRSSNIQQRARPAMQKLLPSGSEGSGSVAKLLVEWNTVWPHDCHIFRPAVTVRL